MNTLHRRRRTTAPARSRLSSQRRARQLRLLQDASHQIAALLDASEVLEQLVQIIRRTMGYQYVSAAMLEGDSLVFLHMSAAPQMPQPSLPFRLPLNGPGLTTWVARNTEAVLVGDVACDARYLPIADMAAIRSMLATPLIGPAGVIGVIAIQSCTAYAFDQFDLSLIHALERYASTAIENARLYQAERQRRRELETLQSITLKLGGDLDLDTVLRTVVESAADVLQADAASILMPGLASDALMVRAHHQLPEDFASSLRAPSRALEEMFERMGRSDILEIASADQMRHLGADAAADAGFSSIAACQLLVKDAAIGILCVYSRTPRRLAQPERHMLAALGQQAAMAINSARRYQHERLLVADLEHSYDEILRTFTELRRTQEKLMHTARLRALGEMASGVAHDFNNLLSGILGNVQLLLLDESDSERKRMLRVIEQATHDSAATVQRIQEFARQREERARELIDLTAVIDSALAITRTRWHDLALRDGRPIQVRREISQGALAIGNPAELREMLVNLIINAIDAMPHGGELTLRLDRRPGRTPFEPHVALIEVCDTGIGIPPELQQRVFESFFTTKPAGQGSGLGLAICQNIISLHGGRIELSSSVGQGTTFRVLLPLDEPAYSSAPNLPAAAPSVSCRVLVVDDEPPVRDILARILRRAGHSVLTAGSGEEALAIFAPGRFDLLFTDLAMPGISGATLLKHLTLQDPRIIPVVVTGWNPQDIGETLPGAAAIVAKPFSTSQITNLVSELISKRTV